MAMCPFATRMMLTEPKSFGKGRNGEIARIVIHHTGVRRGTNASAARSAWYYWSDQGKKGKMVSAHFVIEGDGTIVQLIDTADIGYGTGNYTGHSVHIEHSGSGEPFTPEQMNASALLIGWIKYRHPEVSLNVVGTSLHDYGSKAQEGITCHAWVDQAAIANKLPYAPATPKLACPGKHMLKELPRLAALGRNMVAAAPTVTSPDGVTAAGFFNWSSGSPVSR